MTGVDGVRTVLVLVHVSAYAGASPTLVADSLLDALTNTPADLMPGVFSIDGADPAGEQVSA